MRILKKLGIGRALIEAALLASLGGFFSVVVSFAGGDIIVLTPDTGDEDPPTKFCWYEVKLPKPGSVQACNDINVFQGSAICTQCPDSGTCLTPQDEEGQNRFLNVLIKPDCVVVLTFLRGCENNCDNDSTFFWLSEE